MSDENFYRAFEDRHRGSRATIKHRLESYLAFVRPLQLYYPQAKAIDIGCGRGEWLELLKENGLQGRGIDIDAGMLNVSRAYGLDVEQGDGIALLASLASQSVLVITAFHVVEHISFEQLQELTKEALRVLQPGGLLILETPNPENIKVASENFYLDPTHLKPIPSALLSFVTEYHGFTRSKIVRLQEQEGLSDQLYANIRHIIEGVSPDYAIVAQKDAPSDILSCVDDIFAQKFGLSFVELSEKFEVWMQHTQKDIEYTQNSTTRDIDKTWAHVDRVKAYADMILQKQQEDNHNTWTHAESIAKRLQAKQQEDNHNTFQLAVEALRRVEVVENNYNLMLQSTSWKITKPLRLLSSMTQWFVRGTLSWITLAKGSRPRRAYDAIFATDMPLPQVQTEEPKEERQEEYQEESFESYQEDTPPYRSIRPRTKEIYHAFKRVKREES